MTRIAVLLALGAPMTAWAATDLDGDGFPAAVDCDDADANINPAAVDVPNGVDDDCDGVVDNGGGGTTTTPTTDTGGGRVPDADGDGWAVSDGDCDDADAATYPGAPEDCDGVDNNCDGVVDEGHEWWPDFDADGFGDDSSFSPVVSCTSPGPGYVDVPGDCDDADAFVNPAAVDVPGDGLDADCDGVDGGGGGTTGTDLDGDGYSTGDCDDADATVYPGAPEQCDGRDHDCDGLANEGCGGSGSTLIPTGDDDDDDDSTGDDDDDDVKGAFGCFGSGGSYAWLLVPAMGLIRRRRR